MADDVITVEPADSDDVRWCFEQYYLELGAIILEGVVVLSAWSWIVLVAWHDRRTPKETANE